MPHRCFLVASAYAHGDPLKFHQAYMAMAHRQPRRTLQKMEIVPIVQAESDIERLARAILPLAEKELRVW